VGATTTSTGAATDISIVDRVVDGDWLGCAISHLDPIGTDANQADGRCELAKRPNKVEASVARNVSVHKRTPVSAWQQIGRSLVGHCGVASRTSVDDSVPPLARERYLVRAWHAFRRLSAMEVAAVDVCVPARVDRRVGMEGVAVPLVNEGCAGPTGLNLLPPDRRTAAAHFQVDATNKIEVAVHLRPVGERVQVLIREAHRSALLLGRDIEREAFDEIEAASLVPSAHCLARLQLDLPRTQARLRPRLSLETVEEEAPEASLLPRTGVSPVAVRCLRRLGIAHSEEGHIRDELAIHLFRPVADQRHYVWAHVSVARNCQEFGSLGQQALNIASVVGRPTASEDAIEEGEGILVSGTRQMNRPAAQVTKAVVEGEGVKLALVPQQRYELNVRLSRWVDLHRLTGHTQHEGVKA
jgi:hypothetical protein